MTRMSSPARKLLALVGALSSGLSLHAQTSSFEVSIFADDIRYSNWNAANATQVASPVRSGSAALNILNGRSFNEWTFRGGAHSQSLRNFQSLAFWVYSPVANPPLSVRARWLDPMSGDPVTADAAAVPVSGYATIAANTWTEVVIPVAALASADKIDSIKTLRILTATAITGGVFIDDFKFTGAHATTAQISIDASATLRALPDSFLGTGLAYWQRDISSAGTLAAIQETPLASIRIGGKIRRKGRTDWADQAGFIDAHPNATRFAIVNGWNDDKGTPATPYECMAEVAYANLPAASDTTHPLYANRSIVIPAYVTQEDVSTNPVVYTEPAKPAGWWADLRASAPLAVDDGYNRLRLGRVATFDITHWELDNEPFFETDTNATTYAGWAKQCAPLMKSIDPTIQCGVPARGASTTAWDWPVFTQLASGTPWVPDFLAYHSYVGSRSDEELMLFNAGHAFADATRGPAGNWKTEIARWRSLLGSAFGAATANQVKIAVTEFNVGSDSNPSRAAANLQGALLMADTVGAAAAAGVDHFMSFQLRHGELIPALPMPHIHGWRDFATYGLFGNTTGDSREPEGTLTRHPHFYGLKLASKFTAGAEALIPATSDNPFLSTYAARAADGSVRVLLVNRSKASAIDASVVLSGPKPSGAATQWRYGMTEDNADQTGTTDVSQTAVSLTIAGSGAGPYSFTTSLPPFSATVLVLPPAPTYTVDCLAIADQDGVVTESFNNPGTGVSVSTTGAIGAGDLVKNQQNKGILAFDTSGLPDNALIVSAKIRLNQFGINGTSPFQTHGNCRVAVADAAGFSGSTVLQTSDFNSPALHDDVAVIPETTAAGQWAEAPLDARGRSALNLTGATQFRVEFTLPDNGDGGEDQILWSSGGSSNASLRPVLRVSYQ